MSNIRDNTAIFEELPVPRAVMKMAVPTVISQLIVLIYNMADTFFLGRTGNHLMVAGVSLILPIFNISLSISGLAGIGGGALISRLLGKKRPDEARRVYSFCVYLGALTAAVFSLLTLFFMRRLMTALGANSDTYRYASSYAFCVIVCGGVPTVLSNTLANLIRSVGESKKAGFGITMGGVINIILDPIFMFLIMPDGMEVLGAGVATCLSNCAACLYFIVTLARMRSSGGVLRLTSPRELPERASLIGIFTVGVPSSIATLLFDLDYMLIDKLMSGYDDVALAAIGIVLKVERLPLNVGIGICQGMMPIIAYNYSAKNYKRLNETKRFSLILGLTCAVLSIGLYELFARQIMNIFIDDAATAALGTGFLRARVLATVMMFLCFFHVYLFNGFGKGGYALFLGVSRWLVFNIPMLYILNHFFGMYGVVWSQLAADVLTVILSLAVYRIYSKKAFPAEADRSL